MTGQADDALDVLRAVWEAKGESGATIDEDCSPTRACKNMKDVTFEGFGEPGEDLRTAWRDRLAREGKLQDGDSVADLVLGADPS
jgi:hypothetical protein